MIESHAIWHSSMMERSCGTFLLRTASFASNESAHVPCGAKPAGIINGPLNTNGSFPAIPNLLPLLCNITLTLVAAAAAAAGDGVVATAGFF